MIALDCGTVISEFELHEKVLMNLKLEPKCEELVGTASHDTALNW